MQKEYLHLVIWDCKLVINLSVVWDLIQEEALGDVQHYIQDPIVSFSDLVEVVFVVLFVDVRILDERVVDAL